MFSYSNIFLIFASVCSLFKGGGGGKWYSNNQTPNSESNGYVFNSLYNLMIISKSVLITTELKEARIRIFTGVLFLFCYSLIIWPWISYLIFLHFIVFRWQMTRIYYTLYLRRNTKMRRGNKLEKLFENYIKCGHRKTIIK